jgi:hypothetical protein
MTAGANRERFTVFDYVGFGFSGASLLWAIVALGAFVGVRRGLRGLAMSAAILITLAQPILFFAAMYLPILALADGIQ